MEATTSSSSLSCDSTRPIPPSGLSPRRAESLPHQQTFLLNRAHSIQQRLHRIFLSRLFHPHSSALFHTLRSIGRQYYLDVGSSFGVQPQRWTGCSSPNCSSSSLRQRRQSTASGPPPRIRLAPPLSTAASQVVVRRLLAANCLVLLLSVPKLLARFRKGITRADANEWTRQIQGRPLSPVCPAAPAARPAPVLDL